MFVNSIVKPKHQLVVESLYIYANNGIVYNVVINIIPNMLKKAKRLGLINDKQLRDGVSSIFVDLTSRDHSQLDLTPALAANQRKGRIIIVHTLSNSQTLVYGGEVSEVDQIANIRENIRAKRFKSHRRY